MVSSNAFVGEPAGAGEPHRRYHRAQLLSVAYGAEDIHFASQGRHELQFQVDALTFTANWNNPTVNMLRPHNAWHFHV